MQSNHKQTADSLDINFIWIGGKFTDVEFAMLQPKLLKLKAFFLRAYGEHINFNLLVDREMDISVKKKVINSGVEIHDTNQVYRSLGALNANGEAIFSKEEIHELRRLITLESTGVGIDSAEETWHNKNKGVLNIAKHNPALAADMLKYSLLLLKPSMYIDIGLDNNLNPNVTKDSKQEDSIDFAKKIERYNNKMPSLHWHTSIAIDLEGKLKKDMILSGAPGTSKNLPLDLQILASTSHQECKDILTEILKKCIGAGSEYAGKRKYGSPLSIRRASFTATIFGEVLAKHQQQNHKDIEDIGESEDAEYTGDIKDGCPNFPIIPVSIAGLGYKNRQESTIPDYKKADSETKDILDALKKKIVDDIAIPRTPKF